MSARLQALRASFGPRLGAALDALASRLSLFGGAGPDYFCHPLALPVLQLPVWAADVARRRGAEIPAAAVLDCVEAAATGYLHVRIHDDQMDEGVGEAASAMLLAEALFVRHQVLLARVAPPGSDFWARFQARWLAYGEAMLLEQHLHRTGGVTDAAAFDQVLQRSWPLSLPASAVLSLAALSDGAVLEETLHNFVMHLTRAHQLFTDLLDAEKDLRNKNLTYLVCRFTKGGRDGGERDARELRQRLMLGGGIDAIVAEIHQDLDRAVEAARALGAEEACRFVEARRAFMTDVQRKVFEGFFARLLSSSQSSVLCAAGGT
jgi:hypothetical protein